MKPKKSILPLLNLILIGIIIICFIVIMFFGQRQKTYDQKLTNKQTEFIQTKDQLAS